MKKKMFLLLFALLNAEFTFLWGMESEIPEQRLVIPKQAPFNILLSKEWWVQLGLEQNASVTEIRKRVRELRRKYSVDCILDPFHAVNDEKQATTIVQELSKAETIGINHTTTGSLRTGLIQNAATIAGIYVLYRTAKTNWIKSKIKKLRTNIQKRTPILDKSLRLTTLATGKSCSFVWNSLKIGLGTGTVCLGSVLCGLGLAGGLTKPFAVLPWTTISMPNEQTFRGKDIFPFFWIQNPDSSYTVMYHDGETLKEINDKLKNLPEESIDPILSSLATGELLAGIPLTIGGIEIVISGVTGMKKLFSKKKKSDTVQQ